MNNAILCIMNKNPLLAVDNLRWYPNLYQDHSDMQIRKINGNNPQAFCCRLSARSVKALESFARRMNLTCWQIWLDEETGINYMNLSKRWREKAVKLGAMEVNNAVMPHMPYSDSDHPRIMPKKYRRYT